MTKALFNRYVRKLHFWFGLAIGAQLGLWLISGLFMTWFPIADVRGDHLKAEVKTEVLADISGVISPADVLGALDAPPEIITLKMLAGQPVWYLESGKTRALFDGETGALLSPLSQGTAMKIAQAHYSRKGALDNARLYDTPPREYGRKGPVWRIDFTAPHAASFYVDAVTGEVKAVRTGLWRTFDFMWGLHIMDWKTRDNFNSWWIKMTAALAVIFFLSGLCLLILRLAGMRRGRKPRP